MIKQNNQSSFEDIAVEHRSINMLLFERVNLIVDWKTIETEIAKYYKTAQVYDFKNGNPLIPDNIKYSRYKKNTDGTYAIKNKLLNQC